MKDSREPSVPPRIEVFTGLQAGTPDRFHRVVDDFRVTVDHLLHVAVLLLDFHAVRRARKILHHVLDDAFQQRLFLLQPLIVEVADDEVDPGVFQRAGNADRMQKALLAFGGFGGTGVFRQAIDDGGRDLDGVLHLALGIAGVGQTPSMVMVAPSAEKVSSSMWPALSPSIV